MNNSKLVIENTLQEPEFDRTPMLEEKRAELLKIIEAINKVANSSEWNVLKDYVFDGLVESLERRIKFESAKTTLDDAEIYRLQGTLNLAKKYADFSTLGDAYKVELKNVRKQLDGK